jgi:hypothetical protein
MANLIRGKGMSSGVNTKSGGNCLNQHQKLCLIDNLEKSGKSSDSMKIGQQTLSDLC